MEMAELKDLIPGGHDNDSNSGDSWFVLSSASEEEDEDEESEAEKSNLAQSEDLHKEKKENKEGIPDFIEEPQPLEKSCDDSRSEDKIARMEQSENIQKETAEETEHNHADKLEVTEISEKEIAEAIMEHNHANKLEVTEISGKETAEAMEHNHTDKLEVTEISGKEAAETMVKNKKSEIPMNLEKEQEKQEKNLDYKEAMNKEGNLDYKEVMKKEGNLDYKMKKEDTIFHRDSVITETEKTTSIPKQRRKAKSLLTDEGSHSEIALEVHALRETLIQLSLNLSNTEEEKYSSIASEVQALRETVTELNNDVSNRVSQIEKRTEQVHTLLCRFIMTRHGNYNEPPTQVITAVKEHRPDTSNVAVQTETSGIKQALELRPYESQNALKLNQSKPTNQDGLPNKTEQPSSATDKLLFANKANSGKKCQTAPKALLPTPKILPFKERKVLLTTPVSSKEQLDSGGSKRPRLDNNTSETSKESSHNGTSNEALSSRHHEQSTFYKEKSHHDQNKLKHSKVEHYHNLRESFGHFPTSQQSYNSNRELAELAHRYSSEDSKHQRRKRPRHSQQPNNNRKDTYSKQMKEGQDFHSSGTDLGRASTGCLDDFDMDKVIDEWAQDED